MDDRQSVNGVKPQSVSTDDDEEEENHNVTDEKKDPKRNSRRLHQTAAFYWAFMVFGWVMGQRGTAFLDLLLITGTDVDVGSALFTVAGFAAIAGALAGGFLTDATGRPLPLMAVSFLVNAFANVAIPLTSSLPIMAVLFFLSHFALSLMDVAGNTENTRAWGSGGRTAMQGMHFCFALGAILSPLVTEPFLAPRPEDNPLGSFSGNSSTVSNLTYTQTLNESDSSTLNSSSLNVTSPSSLVNSTLGPQDTKVFYAFLISGLLCLSSAVWLMLLCWWSQSSKSHRTEEDKGSISDIRVLVILAFLIIGIYNFMSSSVEDTFPHYLMTFVVRKLDWDKSSGAKITSVYWVGLALGRLSGMGLVRLTSPTKIIIGCLLSLIVSLLGMLTATLLHIDWGVWITAAAVGLSVAVLFPTSLTYTHERVSRLTGRLAALIFTTPMMAAMLNPLLLAALMTRHDDIWYVYLFLIEGSLALITFIMLHVLAIHLHRARTTMTLVVSLTMEETDKGKCAPDSSEPFLDPIKHSSVRG